MTNSKSLAGRLRPGLAAAAALLAAATFLTACGGAKTDTLPDDQKPNPSRDEALSFQNLPWMPTADPSQWPLGPLSDIVQNESTGSWSMSLAQDGYRVINSEDNDQNLFLRRTMDGPAPPGYRATAYVRTTDLETSGAAVGLILAMSSPEEMAILALNDDREALFYTLEGGELSKPTPLAITAPGKGTDHMLQAIITGNKAALFVDGQFAGMVEGAPSVANSQGMGLFVKGKADVTLNAFTLDILPAFQPPGMQGGPPGMQGGPPQGSQ